MESLDHKPVVWPASRERDKIDVRDGSKKNISTGK